MTICRAMVLLLLLGGLACSKTKAKNDPSAAPETLNAANESGPATAPGGSGAAAEPSLPGTNGAEGANSTAGNTQPSRASSPSTQPDKRRLRTNSSASRVQAPLQMPARAGLIYIFREGDDFEIQFFVDANDRSTDLHMDLGPSTPQEPEDSDPDLDALLNLKDNGADAATLKRNIALATKHVLYGQTYFFERKFGRAMGEVKRALKYNPDSSVAWSLMGSIYYKLNQYKKARIAWQKALKIDPTLENVRTRLAEIQQ